MTISAPPQTEFDAILHDLLTEASADELLAIPGVYEVVSEHYNNDVIQTWQEQQPEIAGYDLGADGTAAPVCLDCADDYTTRTGTPIYAGCGWGRPEEIPVCITCGVDMDDVMDPERDDHAADEEW